MSVIVGKTSKAPAFPIAAKEALGNAQLRRNVHHATNVIRTKRALRVEEMPDWEQLRQAGADLKSHTLAHLDHYLVQFEQNCQKAGGTVHWARDAEEANRIAIGLIQQYAGPGPGTEVIKVKTMTSDEIQLNHALEAAGITPIETDLADMIVQLGHDEPSHIVVPARRSRPARPRRPELPAQQALEPRGDDPGRPQELRLRLEPRARRLGRRPGRLPRRDRPREGGRLRRHL